MAGWWETKILKPIDKVALGEITSHRAVTTVNVDVASKVSGSEGRARNLAAALFEEPSIGHSETPTEPPPLHPALLMLTGLGFALMIVMLTTLMALGLDALFHLDVRPEFDPWGSHD